MSVGFHPYVLTPARSAALARMRDHSDSPPLEAFLDAYSGAKALALFRTGLDTRDIAWGMEATEAAVANAIARARDAAR